MIFFILFSNANNQEIAESTHYITNSKPMSTICQHLNTLCGEERRSKERRMSICLTRFPLVDKENPIYNINRFEIQCVWGFYLEGV